MERTFVLNPKSKDVEDEGLRSGTPILLKPVKEHAERENETEEDEFPGILQEDLVPMNPSKPQSSHRLLWLAIAICLIMNTSLLVVGLLILFGKIGDGCGCSEKNGAQHHKSLSPVKTLPRANGTSTSDLLKYFQSSLNQSLKSTLDKRHDVLAELESTIKIQLENLNSDLKDVKAAVDGIKNDFTDLNYTAAKGRDKPSAHIGSPSRGPKIYKANTVLKDWSNSTPYSHLAGGMTYHDGSLTVPTPGRYYIYAQIYYHNLCHRVAVRVNGNTITIIQPRVSSGRHVTLNAAGLFQLKAGDVISLYAPLEIKVYLDRRHTYFGAFLI